MMTNSKFALVALLAVTTIASPALARSHTSKSQELIAPHAQTMTVSPRLASSRTFGGILQPDSPSATGGGSIGYNQANDNPDHG